jgi:Fe2+ transport system protein B
MKMNANKILNDARKAEREGNTEKAEELYKTIIDSFPDSNVTKEAQLDLNELFKRNGKPLQSFTTQPVKDNIQTVTDEVKCQQCGSQMKKTTKADKSLTLQLLGVVLFLFGIWLLFYFPIGTIFGVILMLGSLRLGYSKKKVWKCPKCGYFFERA